MNFAIDRDMRGNWEAKNDFELGDDRILRVHTHKVYGGNLVTSAHGYQRVGTNGALQHRFSMGMDDPADDFRRTLSSCKVRCTSKAVHDQHSRIVYNSAALVADAITHYAAQKVEA